MKVRYVGCNDVQVGWGGCADPRKVLEVGRLYEVERWETHSFHTKVFLEGVDCGRGFPSAAFEGATEQVGPARGASGD